MELYEFSAAYPELYDRFNADVRYFIDQNKLNGNMSLKDLDDIIEKIIENYENADYYGYAIDDMEDIPVQQIPFGRFDNDFNPYRRRRGYRRRRFRDFDTKDIFRILFLRDLFDRRYW